MTTTTYQTGEGGGPEMDGAQVNRRDLFGLVSLMLLAGAVGLVSDAAASTGTSDDATGLAFTFPSIDGGDLHLSDWAGRPILVVNTASRCGFTHQYDALQELYDRYRTDGLVVLAVPSGDFRQELATNSEVRTFCEMNFGLDIPMAEITSVRGPEAHPFYAWMAREHQFRPQWNFNKVLLDGAGNVVQTWGSRTEPLDREISGRIEALLAN